MKRTGTLKVDVQFIPWLQNPDKSPGSIPALDFTLQREGVSQALARDLDLQFRRLPSGASPGLLDWAELTSTLATQIRYANPAASRNALERDDSSSSPTIQNLNPEVISGDSDVVVASTSEGTGDSSNKPTESETYAEIQRHHRMARGISEGRHLAQICSLDNADTDTQASIWADFKRKQVH